MTTKRTSILTELENRMKSIDGTGSYINDFSSRVSRVTERPDIRSENFKVFPWMFIYLPSIEAEWWFGSVWQETMRPELVIAFNSKLTAAQADDVISDLMAGLGNDLKFSGQALYTIFTGFTMTWLPEETLTEIVANLEIVYRRTSSER